MSDVKASDPDPEPASKRLRVATLKSLKHDHGRAVLVEFDANNSYAVYAIEKQAAEASVKLAYAAKRQCGTFASRAAWKNAICGAKEAVSKYKLARQGHEEAKVATKTAWTAFQNARDAVPSPVPPPPPVAPSDASERNSAEDTDHAANTRVEADDAKISAGLPSPANQGSGVMRQIPDWILGKDGHASRHPLYKATPV